MVSASLVCADEFPRIILLHLTGAASIQTLRLHPDIIGNFETLADYNFQRFPGFNQFAVDRICHVRRFTAAANLRRAYQTAKSAALDVSTCYHAPNFPLRFSVVHQQFADLRFRLWRRIYYWAVPL